MPEKHLSPAHQRHIQKTITTYINSAPLWIKAHLADAFIESYSIVLSLLGLVLMLSGMADQCCSHHHPTPKSHTSLTRRPQPTLFLSRSGRGRGLWLRACGDQRHECEAAAAHQGPAGHPGHRGAPVLAVLQPGGLLHRGPGQGELVRRGGSGAEGDGGAVGLEGGACLLIHGLG